MSGIYNVGYCAMTWCDFRNMSSGHVLFFNRYSTTINIVKEKQNGSITKGSFGHSSFSRNTAKSFSPSKFALLA